MCFSDQSVLRVPGLLMSRAPGYLLTELGLPVINMLIVEAKKPCEKG